jgi:hypothetical protein
VHALPESTFWRLHSCLTRLSAANGKMLASFLLPSNQLQTTAFSPLFISSRATVIFGPSGFKHDDFTGFYFAISFASGETGRRWKKFHFFQFTLPRLSNFKLTHCRLTCRIEFLARMREVSQD